MIYTVTLRLLKYNSPVYFLSYSHTNIHVQYGIRFYFVTFVNDYSFVALEL